KDPSFVFVRKEMRITAVGCVSVFVDQVAEYVDSFFSSRGALHGDARKVGVLRSSLPVRSHLHKLFSRVRPDIACRDVLLVESAVGQRRRKTCELGVIRCDVPVCLVCLWDLGELTRKVCVLSGAYGYGCIFWVFLCRDDLYPVAGGLMSETSEHGMSVLGQIAAHVKSDRFIGC